LAKLRWGIKTAPQHTTCDAMLRVWQEADRTPAFEHAWLFDHFSPLQGDLDGCPVWKRGDAPDRRAARANSVVWTGWTGRGPVDAVDDRA
jgi:hypothetical protein